jgi:hypothetical protein
MWGASALVVMLCLSSLCLECVGQSIQPPPDSQNRGLKDQQVVDLPLVKRTYRPKLSLQDALKIAEGYIDKEHIPISSYWLSQAKFTLYGSADTPDKDKIPCWYFWWANDKGLLGDYVEIFVDMDRKAWRVPSM